LWSASNGIPNTGPGKIRSRALFSPRSLALVVQALRELRRRLARLD
jgi:hypothetical protein